MEEAEAPESVSGIVAPTSLRKKTGSNAQKESSTKKPLRVRKEFPETWLWTEETIRFVCIKK